MRSSHHVVIWTSVVLADAKFWSFNCQGTQNIQNDCHPWLSDRFRVHQIRIRPGSAPDPAGGAYSAPQTPSWFKGIYFEGEERGGKGRVEGEIKGRGGNETDWLPLCLFLDPPLQKQKFLPSPDRYPLGGETPPHPPQRRLRCLVPRACDQLFVLYCIVLNVELFNYTTTTLQQRFRAYKYNSVLIQMYKVLPFSVVIYDFHNKTNKYIKKINRFVAVSYKRAQLSVTCDWRDSSFSNTAVCSIFVVLSSSSNWLLVTESNYTQRQAHLILWLLSKTGHGHI